MARPTKGRLFKRDAAGKAVPKAREKDAAGTWYVEYFVNGRRLVESLQTGDRAKAETARDRIILPIQKGSAAEKRQQVVHRLADARSAARAAADVPLAEVWDWFTAGSARAAGTTRRYAVTWSKFLAWLQRHAPAVSTLAKLDRMTALKFADFLSAQGTAPRTFNADRHALSLIFRKVALKAGLELPDPWQFVECKPLRTRSKVELSTAQASDLLARLAEPGFRVPAGADEGGQRRWRELAHREEWEVVFALGMFAGLRLADAVLLQWPSVDFVLGELSLIPVKTSRKGTRVHVPLHPELRSRLEQAAAWRGEHGEDVCPHLAERYRRAAHGVQGDAVRVFEGAGLTVREAVPGRTYAASRIGFHSLRHSFVSWCASAGVPLATVQAMVGHGNPAMTRHYAHLTAEARRQAVESLPAFAPAAPALSAPTTAADGTPTRTEALARIRARLAADDVPEALRADLLTQLAHL